MKKPLLYDLVRLLFPRVLGRVYAEGHAAGHTAGRAPYMNGYEKAKSDIVRSMMANLNTWYSCSTHVDDDGYGWYDVTIPSPDKRNV